MVSLATFLDNNRALPFVTEGMTLSHKDERALIHEQEGLLLQIALLEDSLKVVVNSEELRGCNSVLDVNEKLIGIFERLQKQLPTHSPLQCIVERATAIASAVEVRLQPAMEKTRQVYAYALFFENVAKGKPHSITPVRPDVSPEEQIFLNEGIELPYARGTQTELTSMIENLSTYPLFIKELNSLRVLAEKIKRTIAEFSQLTDKLKSVTAPPSLADQLQLKTHSQGNLTTLVQDWLSRHPK